MPNSGFFNIDGPRFSLPATEVAGVFPPPNAHGGFDETIPHVLLLRRTLPWERALTSNLALIGNPASAANDPPPPDGPAPWLALLLFQEGEYTIHQNVSLQQAVPTDVYARLNPPAGITCDTVQASRSLISSILPSLEELTLLAHVRQVNVEDRELNTNSTDGWFAVLMSNRLPTAGAKYRACLVSLEERTDLVAANPPAVAQPLQINPIGGVAGAAAAAEIQTLDITIPILANADDRRITSAIGIVESPVFGYWEPIVQLVLLHSWQFECAGIGTFRDYMQRVNVSTSGTVEDPGHPPVADTGHIPITVADRAGVDEQAWYRGPLVPIPLTRDPLTYHSADQCRRATPETGAEDISYAAAFESGRLLAAADARLAQELMRWRRDAYRQSARIDCLSAVQSAMSLAQPLDPHSPVLPVIAVNAAQSVLTSVDKVGDRYGMAGIGGVAGLNPNAVKQAWNLASADQATAMLGGDASATGATVTAPPQTARPNVTLDQVAADTARLQNLTTARGRILANTQQKLGGA